MIMTTSVVVLEPGKGAGRQTVHIPMLGPDWVLVDVKAIALNPSDWKNIDYEAADLGSRVGCDYAGLVKAVGPNIKHSKRATA